MLLLFARRRRDVPFRWLFVLFGAFIVSCGFSHLLDVVTTHAPAYRLYGGVKVVTAVVSWATVLALLPVVPKALALRSPEALEREVRSRTAELERAVAALRAEVEERKRAERQVREGRELLQLVTDRAPVLLALCDADRRFRFVNRPYAERFGLDPAAVVGRTIPEVVGDEAYARVREHVDAAVAGREAEFEVEIPFVQPGRRVVHCAYRPHVDEAGGVRGLVATITDVTERVRAEEALRELNATLERRVAERTAAVAASEALLRQFIAHAPAAIAMLDRDMRYLRTSERWRADYQLGDTDLVGRSHYEVLPEQPDRWKEVHRRVLAGAVERCDEDPFTRADGSVEWLQWEARPWHAADGSVGGLLFFMQVITARKRAELALRASEKQFRFLADNIPPLVWVLDGEGGAVRYNRRWYGYTGQTALDTDAGRWHEAVHPDDRDDARAHWERCRLASERYSVEYRLRRTDGEYRWFLSQGVPMRDADGRVVRWFGTCTDIHDQRSAQESLLASLREKETLLKEVHHRVKNNLAVVVGLLNLQAGKTADPVAGELLRESRNRVRAMAVVHETLYQSGQLARVELGPYVQKLCDHLWQSYGVPRGRVGLACRVEDRVIELDLAVPLGLILNELVSNALKHAFPDGRGGTVTVEAAGDGGSFRLSVADDGVGRPPGPADARSLGLRLVSNLTRQANGTLAVEPAPEAGTRFTLLFPPPAGGGPL